MENIRFLSLVAIVLVMSACATVGQMQASCYKIHEKFKDAYSCISHEISKDPRFNSPAKAGLISEYQITAEVLQDKVNNGEMTDAEAKLALAQKRAELGARERGHSTVTSSPY